MTQYIDKDALAAELERKIRTEQGYSSGDAECGYRDCAREILSFLDTLETKEVDLEEEVDKWYDNEAPKEFEHILYREIENFAKYFFELGLKAKDP